MTENLPTGINNYLAYSKMLPLMLGVSCKRANQHTHIHDCSTLWYALSGEGTHSVGNATYNQKPGTCILIPAFVPHCIDTSDSEDTPVFLSVNIFDAPMQKRGYNLFSYYNKQMLFENTILPVFRQFSEEEQKTANRLAYDMSNESFKKQTCDYNKLCGLFAGFLRLLGGEPSDVKLSATTHIRTNAVLSAVAYINKHFAEKITVHDLCTVSNLSKTVFCEAFRQLTGLSTTYYIRCIRLQRAKKLFILRGKTLSQAAKEVGIANKVELSRMFTRHYGMTFTEYRQLNLLSESKEDFEVREKHLERAELLKFFSNQNL